MKDRLRPDSRPGQVLHIPSYLALHRTGELNRRTERVRRLMEDCRLCPRRCRIDRMRGRTGFCRSGAMVRVYKFKVHHGEEPPISGTRGSGIVFFANCTLRCVYCQNAPMSHWGRGVDLSPDRLADIFLFLQNRGCHNLNLVTATHYLYPVLQALELAAERGLHLPIVWNTSGYESPELLQLLDGIVDIYLPDMKYADPEVARRYSAAPDYPAVNLSAVEEMFRQVGPLQLDPQSAARRGLIIRHLVLPHDLAGTEEIMRLIADRISRRVHVSLMSQYLPVWSARRDPLLNRPLTEQEYRRAVRALENAGLSRGWTQGLPCSSDRSEKTGCSPLNT
jgi:putative pyruvate formate lyase activating enzyme